jgi:hypothetical protein
MHGLVSISADERKLAVHFSRREIPVPVGTSQIWLRRFTAARDSEQFCLGHLNGRTWEVHSAFAFAFAFFFSWPTARVSFFR